MPNVRSARRFLCACAVIAVFATAAVGQRAWAGDVQAVNSAAVAAETRLLAKHSPDRHRLNAAATELATLASTPPPKGTAPKTLVDHARSVASKDFRNLPIEDAVLLLVITMAKAQDEDLRSSLAELKALAALKACARDRACWGNVKPNGEFTITQLNALRARVTPDNIEGTSSMTEMRMQMALQRRDQALTALSNMLKKQASTAASVAGNIR